MEAPIPMDNKAKTLPPYGGMMPPLNHHLQLHGPAPPGFQRTPPPPPPPHDGQPHGLPAPIPHTSTYEQHWHQPYPPSHYETAAQRRHSNPVTQPPPQSQPPPPGPPPLPSHPHAPYPPPSQHPSAQPQSRELPQLPPGDPYHRPNSLPAPAPSHPVSEPHSPRTYRPMNGAQSEPTPHSAPPPVDYRPARVPCNGPGEPPATNGEHAAPPPGYMQHAPPHHGPPPQGAMYDNSGAPYPRQRKVARAQQACDQCRARKAKCDEGRPACSHCRENNIECKYKDIPPQKQEKSTQLVLDGVRQNEDNSRERYDTLMGRFLEIEQLLKYIITKSNIPLPPEKSPRPLKENATSPNGLLESKPSTPAPQAPEVRLNNIPAASSSQSEMNRDITGYLKTVQYEQSRPLVEGGNKEIEGELSIPQNHKTAAHKLLEWDSIKRLLDRKIDPNYVLINERKRGLIRLYGCGEGCDHDTENHWRQNRRYPGASPATDSTSPQSAEEYSQASSPNWGYGLPMPPQNRPGPNCGGVDQSGFLNTQPDVVRRLLDSYMSNMHILHPIMDKNTLPQKVERFIQQYGQYHRNMDYSNTANIANEGRGMKRKRSAEAIYTEALNMSRSPSSEKWSPRRIEHSIENAVILLVLALGAICEHKGALPGFAPDPNERHRDKQDFASSPEVQAVLEEILSPPSGPVSGLNSRLYQSPSIQSSDPAWTPNQRPNSRLGPEGMTETSYLKNIDVIPGLAYYAYAAGILGEMQGGCELPFVQAAILASFYAGQLAHPFQSHGWICQAARACSFLTRKDEYNVMQNSSLKELYEFAYWTCLQHESDLLAELDFTASGVTQSESRVLLPGGTFTMDQPRPMTDHRTRVMFFYSAQIHLRKVLNQVHRDLYNVDVKKLPHIVLSILGLNLDAWKSSLPAEMQWSEGDPPSDDINTARLRAKYYGARYIIYRPVLELALHSKSPKAEGKGKSEKESKPSASSFKAHDYQAPSMARWSSEPGMRQNMRDISDIEDTLKLEELDNDTRRACEQCITAAIESTRAFHNIKGRPIVTNIFGTAHAQFGNMLVLSATYMSNLRELVQVKDLQQLLKRTIQFLAMYKDISPTLMADAQILSGIYYRIFKKEVQTSFTTESFGST